MLHNFHRFDESVARSDVGLKQVEPYLRIEPNDAGAREICLQLHGNRALALSELGKHRESAGDWTRVIELSSQPVPSGYRIGLACELVKVGEFARASAEARLVQAAPDLSGQDRYNFGCYFALCEPRPETTRVSRWTKNRASSNRTFPMRYIGSGLPLRLASSATPPYSIKSRKIRRRDPS